MAKSMTGWGRDEFQIGGDHYSMEARSLNHRFLDVSLRMQDRFSPFESRIREEIKKRFSRGSFSINISLISAETPELRLNLPIARIYIDAAAELKDRLGVKGEMDVSALLKLKDIFSFERKGAVSDADWEPIGRALFTTLDQIGEWRVKEGAALKQDLASRLEAVGGLLFRIEARAPRVIEAYRQRLREEMEKVIKDRVDESRILLEAAVFADRTDISEEITRLKSHLDMFRKFLKFNEPIGKRLDFLCQEIGREVNTIGSKPSDVEITQTVVEMKGEVEKIREQVQNVE
ncbi:MAG: YicC family protein [Deltaproteobacteria bacterium]|nr:YicC family protein [Deltaproteobacteria bacterium]